MTPDDAFHIIERMWRQKHRELGAEAVNCVRERHAENSSPVALKLYEFNVERLTEEVDALAIALDVLRRLP